MKTKVLCCLSFGMGLVVSLSLSVVAKQSGPQLFGDNIFCWYSDVPDNPMSNTVVNCRMSLIGSGGIKIVANKTKFGKYEVCIDGSAISANGGAGSGASTGTGIGSGTDSTRCVHADTDFEGKTNLLYFVNKSAVCTLPSAVGLAGKEILVWNACPSGGIVTYKTLPGQTLISAKGFSSNETPGKLDRIMSDGSNWFKE